MIMEGMVAVWRHGGAVLSSAGRYITRLETWQYMNHGDPRRNLMT
jgi:hypothetical protein